MRCHLIGPRAARSFAAALRPAVVFVLCSTAAVAQAQTTTNPAATDPYAGSSLNVTFTAPGSSVGALDCAARATCPPVASGCKPLNRAACGEYDDPSTAREIQLSILPKSPIYITTNAQLLIWLEIERANETASNRCLWSGQSSDLLVPAQPLDLNGPLLNGNTTAYAFPGALSSNNSSSVVLSTADIYAEALGGTSATCAPSGGGQNSTAVRICFGIDYTDNNSYGGSDDKITQNEPRGWARIVVDTRAPAAPKTPSVEDLDGAVALDASLPSTADATDVAFWQVHYRPVSTKNPKTSCDTWSGCSTVASAGSKAVHIEVSGLKNGTQYELCALTVDALGNTSDPSPTVTGLPRNECDFFECYPGTPLHGYCGAASVPGIAALLIGVGLWRRRRRIPC